MAKITDPDLLNQVTEVIYDTTNKTIQLLIAGNLSNDGVSLQAVYSFSREEWKTDPLLSPYPFPLIPIDGPSAAQFHLVDGWTFKDITTSGLIRDGGWAVKDALNISTEEWMNITTLGVFTNPLSDIAYYTQDNSSFTNISLSGPVNQAIKIYGDISNGNFDYRSIFKIFLSVYGTELDEYNLLAEQNLSALTYKKYALPLSNPIDIYVVANQATASAYNVQFDGVTSIITNSGEHTQQEVYDAAQYWHSLQSNTQYNNPVETFDGVSFTLGSGWVIATNNNITGSGTEIIVTGGKYDSTATSGSTTTLTDITQSWTINKLTGRIIWIRSGTGVGAVGEIISNTSTTITVTAFVQFRIGGIQTFTPDNTSVYSISYNFQDMIDDFIQGISKSGDSSYTLNSKLTLQTNGCLHDSSILLAQDVGSSLLGIDLRGGTLLQWGYLDENDSTKGGISWIFKTNQNVGGVANNFTDGATAVGDFRMYASSATVTAPKATTGSFWRIYFDANTFVDMKDVLFNTFKGGMRLQGTNSRVENVTFIDQQTNVGPMNFIGELGLAKNINASNSDYAFYWWQSKPGCTVRGLSSRDIEFATVFINGGNNTGGLRLIDYSGDPITFQQSGANDAQKIEEIYSYTPLVVDSVSNSVQSMQLYIEDVNSIEVINKSSDVNGEYTENLLFKGKYVASDAGVITLETPHIIKYRLYGKEFQQFIFTADAPFKSKVGTDVNINVVVSSITASGYTGVTIDGVLKTITISQSRTIQEIYDYSQWWASQSANMKYDEPLTTADKNNFNLTSGWKLILQIEVNGGININGNVELSSIINLSNHNINGNLDLITNGTYIFANSYIQDLSNSSGGNVIINGQSFTYTNNNGPNIIINESYSLTLTGLVPNTEIRVYKVSDDTEMMGIENSGTSFSGSYNYTSDIDVYIIILHIQYLHIKLNITLSNLDTILPISQDFDRNYKNP